MRIQRSGEESLSLLEEKTYSDSENGSIAIESSRLYPSRSIMDLVAPYFRPIRLPHLRTAAANIAIGLIPSFLRNNSGSSQKKLASTAYLDGMRGLAALFVFFCHYSYTCFVITVGYGYGKPGENRNLLQLPIIRLLYSGPPMVCVFFVISGYALSLKPLRQMRAGEWNGLMATMSSSVFRRGLRLFIPTFSSCFLVFLMLRLGWYEPTRRVAESGDLHRNVHEFHPLLLESFGSQINNWIWEMYTFICVFDWTAFAGSTGYDVHLWTIPVEYRASLILFLTLVGLARLKPWVRMSTLVGLMVFVIKKDRWELLLFYCGMFIAETDLISPSLKISNDLSYTRSRITTTIWITTAIISLYLMSQPDQFFENTPGWRWLSSIIPEWFTEKYRYYQTLGSITLVFAINRLPILQKPFNHPVIQYFGKISYALYLMHGPVMHVVGYLIEKVAWNITGHETEGAYVAGFILGAVVNVPLVIWASDVFWRAIDAPSVKFARWVENKSLVDDSKAKPRELPR